MIVAFTGAGISKDSGIFTFQDKPGIREKLTRDFATNHPYEYIDVMKEFIETVNDKEPNAAHIALAEYDIPVITMNVDGLHEKAGTKHLIPLHGRLPNDKELDHCYLLYNTPVLYGDPAPNYERAYDLLWLMDSDDILLVVGASTYTSISVYIRDYVKNHRVRIVEIQNDASIEVPKFLKAHSDKIESYDDFIKRADKYNN